MLPKFPNLRIERINLQFSTLLSKTNSAEGRVHATRLNRDETGRETAGGTHRQAFHAAAAAVVVVVVPPHRRVTSADPAGAAARGPRRVHRAVEPLGSGHGPLGRVDSPAIRRRNPGIFASVSGKGGACFCCRGLIVWDGVDWRVGGRGWMWRARRQQNELSRVFRELIGYKNNRGSVYSLRCNYGFRVGQTNLNLTKFI
jgi:hypothetical protein